MKEKIHPKYGPVIFRDASNGQSFLIGSTMSSGEKAKWEDGKEYPVVNLEISSSSHPFYTGKQRLVDSQGRVEKFQKKFATAGGLTHAKRKTRKKEPERKSKI